MNTATIHTLFINATVGDADKRFFESLARLGNVTVAIPDSTTYKRFHVEGFVGRGEKHPCPGLEIRRNRLEALDTISLVFDFSLQEQETSVYEMLKETKHYHRIAPADITVDAYAFQEWGNPKALHRSLRYIAFKRNLPLVLIPHLP